MTQINNSWIVWYHNPSDTEWGKTSYKDIIEITSIEDYCVLKNSWNACLPKVSEGMFFLMRKLKNGISIYPQWEDTRNIEGGCWSFKIIKEQCESVWFTLMKHVMGECLIKKTIDYSIINGISISPKKHFSIVKIWLSKNNIEYITELLGEDVQFLNLQSSIYTKHSSNIQKDSKKNARIQHASSRYKKKNNNNRKNNQYRDFNNKNKCSW